MERKIAALQILMNDRRRTRVAMRGSSMLPSLHEPMVLDLVAPHDIRLGDVVVFRQDNVLVAHRVVACRGQHLLTSGDAQPDVVEQIGKHEAIGRVSTVWMDASPGAQRIDGTIHRLRSFALAYFHPIRSMLFRWKLLLKRAVDAAPWKRSRAFPHLLEAVTGAVRENPQLLVNALQINPARLRSLDQRHRCMAFLGESARRLAITENIAPPTALMLREARHAAVVRASRMHAEINTLVGLLCEASYPFALLKGASRLFNGMEDALYHPSGDIDIIFRREHVDDVIRALQRAGYHFRADTDEIRKHVEHHHHAAPLYPPNEGFFIEIHHALAPPGMFSLQLDWHALDGHFLPVENYNGMFELDAVATALHLAIHASGLESLRDIVLLSRLLLQFDAEQRTQLFTFVRREYRERIRLEAMLALAAHIAGIPWPYGRRAKEYLAWVLRREDLPILLRERSITLDLLHAQASPRSAWKLLSMPSQHRPHLPLMGRAASRAVISAGIACYEKLMPEISTGKQPLIQSSRA